MSGQVLVRKSYSITGVVVSAPNVREIASIVAALQSPDETRRSDDRHFFILRSSDGTQYDTEDVCIVDEGGVLDTRRIVSIEMTFNDSYTDQRLSVSLQHGGGRYGSDNSVRVSGTDETWVDGTAQSVRDCVSNWKSQVMWPHGHSWLVTIGFTMAFVAAVMAVMRMVWVVKLARDPEKLVDCVWLATSVSAMMWLPAYYLMSFVQRLYPTVEFAMGPDHQRTEEARRRKLRGPLVAIALPLGLAALSEVVLRVLGW